MMTRKRVWLIACLLVQGALVAQTQTPVPSGEVLSLRKELMDLQFAAMNSTNGVVKRQALQQADRALRERMVQIPELRALETERAQLREKMKALLQRENELITKYAPQIAPEKQTRDAAAQQLNDLMSGGSRGAEIKARLAVLAPEGAQSR